MWIALYTLGGIVFALGFFMFCWFLPPKKPSTVSVFDKEVKEKFGSPLSPLLKPLAPFNDLLIKSMGLKESLNNSLYIAKWNISPGEFLAGKELLALIFFLLAVVVFNVSNRFLLLLIPILGFFLPDVILSSRVQRRKYEIVRVLPETVELLSLCVGGGLDFMAAIRWVVNKSRANPLIEELAIVLREINVGKPRVEALKDMSKRLNIPDISSFVRILIQADRMGTPVEDTLKIVSEDTRLRRFHRGEKLAMKAPLKMLIPLIFCILPVILIIVAGPVLISFAKGNIGEIIPPTYSEGPR